MLNKRSLILAVLAYCAASAANAIPFNIASTNLDVDVALGGGLGFQFTPNTGFVGDLGEGESKSFNFGRVYVPLAAATGAASLTVEFATPETESSAVSTGAFKLISLILFSVGDLIWGDPIQIDYSYAGLTGGKLQIAMSNISGKSLGTSWDLWGKITNIKSPGIAVPEPAGLVLMSCGLIALALVRRKGRPSRPSEPF